MLNANHDAADANQHELHCSRKIRNPDVNIFLIFVFQSSFALGIFIAIAIEQGRGGGVVEVRVEIPLGCYNPQVWK